MSRYTTVEIGRAYEFHCVRYLNTQLHMSLIRIGKAGDEGIDMRGDWWLPSPVESSGSAPPESSTAAARKMRVVGQCKALSKPLGGIAIRELEGVMAHLRDRSTSPIAGPSSSPSRSDRMPGPLGVLASQSGFSQAAMQRALRSPSPLLLLHLPGGRPPEYDEEGNSMVAETTDEEAPDFDSGRDLGLNPAGVWWNTALSDGVLRGELELRREILGLRPPEKKGGPPISVDRFSLWHHGQRLGRLDAAADA